MMTAVLVGLVVTACTVAVLLRRRDSARSSDLGGVSEAWLAEEKASGPRRQ